MTQSHDKGHNHEQYGRKPLPPRRGELLDALPPDLRKDVEGLRAHEERVMKALDDPDMRELFRRDPSLALARMRVPVPPRVKAKLRAADMSALDFTQPRTFRLPNGQTVTAKIRVNFTRG